MCLRRRRRSYHLRYDRAPTYKYSRGLKLGFLGMPVFCGVWLVVSTVGVGGADHLPGFCARLDDFQI
jgi:hypothetical protein